VGSFLPFAGDGVRCIGRFNSVWYFLSRDFGSGSKVSGSGSVPYIRNPVSDPGGQKLPIKVEKIKKFHVLKCWMFSVES